MDYSYVIVPIQHGYYHELHMVKGEHLIESTLLPRGYAKVLQSIKDPNEFFLFCDLLHDIMHLQNAHNRLDYYVHEL